MNIIAPNLSLLAVSGMRRCWIAVALIAAVVTTTAASPASAAALNPDKCLVTNGEKAFQIGQAQVSPFYWLSNSLCVGEPTMKDGTQWVRASTTTVVLGTPMATRCRATISAFVAGTRSLAPTSRSEGKDPAGRCLARAWVDIPTRGKAAMHDPTDPDAKVRITVFANGEATIPQLGTIGTGATLPNGQKRFPRGTRTLTVLVPPPA